MQRSSFKSIVFVCFFSLLLQSGTLLHSGNQGMYNYKAATPLAHQVSTIASLNGLGAHCHTSFQPRNDGDGHDNDYAMDIDDVKSVCSTGTLTDFVSTTSSPRTAADCQSMQGEPTQGRRAVVGLSSGLPAIGATLGRGSFGCVVSGMLSSQGVVDAFHKLGMLPPSVAVKFLLPPATPAARRRVAAEIRTLRTLSAPGSLSAEYFPRFYGAWEEASTGRIAIVMESLPRGTLKPFRGRIVDASVLLWLMHSLASGLALMHEKGLVHRDVKLSNIMLAADGHAVKIIDFGLVGADQRRLAEYDRRAERASAEYWAPCPQPVERPGQVESKVMGSCIPTESLPLTLHRAGIKSPPHLSYCPSPQDSITETSPGYTPRTAQTPHSDCEQDIGSDHVTSPRRGERYAFVRPLFTTRCGSGKYMAPEVVRGLRYDAAVDVYSLGVVTRSLVAAELLSKLDTTACEAGTEGSSRRLTPDEAVLQSLLCRTLDPNPLNRPSTGEIAEETRSARHYAANARHEAGSSRGLYTWQYLTAGSVGASDRPMDASSLFTQPLREPVQKAVSGDTDRRLCERRKGPATASRCRTVHQEQRLSTLLRRQRAVTFPNEGQGVQCSGSTSRTSQLAIKTCQQ